MVLGLQILSIAPIRVRGCRRRARVPRRMARESGILQRRATDLQVRHPAFLSGRHPLRLWRPTHESHEKIVQVIQPASSQIRPTRGLRVKHVIVPRCFGLKT